MISPMAKKIGISSIVALVLLFCGGAGFVMGMQVRDAVLEVRVGNLEKRHDEMLAALRETNERLNGLIDILWSQREDNLKLRREAK